MSGDDDSAAPAVASPKTSPATSPPPAAAAPTGLQLLPGLPAAVARELRYENVVVVSLYAAKAPGDRKALAHARVGAKQVGAGFVALNLYDERKANSMVKFLGDDRLARRHRRPPSRHRDDADPGLRRRRDRRPGGAERQRRQEQEAQELSDRELFAHELRRDGRPVVTLRGIVKDGGSVTVETEVWPVGSKPNREPRRRPFAFGNARAGRPASWTTRSTRSKYLNCQLVDL